MSEGLKRALLVNLLVWIFFLPVFALFAAESGDWVGIFAFYLGAIAWCSLFIVVVGRIAND